MMPAFRPLGMRVRCCDTEQSFFSHSVQHGGSSGAASRSATEEIDMKNLIPLAVALAGAMSIGTTLALADGGETGADAAHTQSYGRANGSNFYGHRGAIWHAPFRHERFEWYRGRRPHED
jgi:hypothetical protein